MITARELGQRSMAAVEAGDRQAWLALFAEDGVVEDPIGPSAFDPEGNGHRGPEAIAAFYDSVIGVNESIRFDIRQSFLCGDEAANGRHHPHHLRRGIGRSRSTGSTSTAGRRDGPDRVAPGLLGARRHPHGALTIPYPRTLMGATQSGMAMTICTSLMYRSAKAPAQ